MKTVINGYQEPISMMMRELPIGVLAIFTDPTTKAVGHVVVRCYGNRVVSLTDPSKTWSWEKFSGKWSGGEAGVRILPLGTEVVIRQDSLEGVIGDDA